MRIKCPYCGKAGIISNTKECGTGEKDAYVNCSTPGCGARTVHRISYLHDIRPPESDMFNMIEELIGKMCPERRSELMIRFGDKQQESRIEPALPFS